MTESLMIKKTTPKIEKLAIAAFRKLDPLEQNLWRQTIMRNLNEVAKPVAFKTIASSMEPYGVTHTEQLYTKEGRKGEKLLFGALLFYMEQGLIAKAAIAGVHNHNYSDQRNAYVYYLTEKGKQREEVRASNARYTLVNGRP